jgi:transcriptional regulator with XRE-family HTH domain
MKLTINSPADIGAIARITRLSLDLNPATIAEQAGISEVIYRNIETGLASIELDSAIKVLLSLGVQIQLTLPPQTQRFVQNIDSMATVPVAQALLGDILKLQEA